MLWVVEFIIDALGSADPEVTREWDVVLRTGRVGVAMLPGELGTVLPGVGRVDRCDGLAGVVPLAPDTLIGVPSPPEQPAVSSAASSAVATIRIFMTTSPPHPAADSVRAGTVTPSRPR